MSLVVESRIRDMLKGRQVSPEAIRVLDAYVEAVVGEVALEAEGTGARRIDGTLVRRVLRYRERGGGAA